MEHRSCKILNVKVVRGRNITKGWMDYGKRHMLLTIDIERQLICFRIHIHTNYNIKSKYFLNAAPVTDFRLTNCLKKHPQTFTGITPVMRPLF